MVNNLNTFSNPFQTQAGQPQLYYALPVKLVPAAPSPSGSDSLTTSYGSPSTPYGAQNQPQGGYQAIISNLLGTINSMTASLSMLMGGKMPYNKPDCPTNESIGDTSEEEGTGDSTGDSSCLTPDYQPTPHYLPKKTGYPPSALKNPFGDPNDPDNVKHGSPVNTTNPKLVRLNNVRAAQALAAIRASYPSETTYDDPFLQQVEKDHSEDNLHHSAEILLGNNNETGARAAMEKLYGKGDSVSIDDVNNFTLRYNPDEINPASASGTPDDKKAATALTTLTKAYKSKTAGWDDDFLRSVVVENSNINNKYTNAAKVLLGFDNNGNARTSWVNLLNNGVTDLTSIKNFIQQANNT